MPDLILIAGPNGAGKTTFARNSQTNRHSSREANQW
jgi:predicted ABC-type ATPase